MEGLPVGIRHVSSLQDFRALIATKGHLICVDFFADWCGPCRMISPYIESLSQEFVDVIFAKVDVDNSADIAGSCSVRAMPTFHFYLDGVLVESFEGADRGKLRDAIVRFRTAAKPSAWETSGHVLGAAPVPAAAPQVQAAQAAASPFKEQLLAMGFQIAAVDGAVNALGGEASLGALIDWIADHPDGAPDGVPSATAVPAIEVPQPTVPVAELPVVGSDSQKSVTLEEQQALLRQKIAELHARRAEASKSAEVSSERKRREEAKDLGQAREARMEMLRQRDAEDRQKEKERVRAQKAALREKVRLAKLEHASQTRAPAAQPAVQSPPQTRMVLTSSATEPVTGSTPCVVRVRLPDGQPVEVSSGLVGDSTLWDLFQELSATNPELSAGPGSVAFVSAFPRRTYMQEEFDAYTLLDVGIAPKGTLMLQRS